MHEKFHARQRFVQPGAKKPLASLQAPGKAPFHPVPTFFIQDELTGVYNFSYLQDRIVREFSRATRYNFPLSFLLVDVDSKGKSGKGGGSSTEVLLPLGGGFEYWAWDDVALGSNFLVNVTDDTYFSLLFGARYLF